MQTARALLCASMLALGLGFGTPALAAPPPDMAAAGLERGPTLAVVSTVDGDTVLLEDRSELRLTGIQAPKLPLGRQGFRAWPLAEEAKTAMERLADGEQVTLWHGDADMDRHGRRLGHAVTGSGDWLQGVMLDAGLARVYTFRDNRGLATEMLALEETARDGGRGIWALDWYRVRTPDGLEADIDTFQLVEGRVVSARRVRDNVYLNFGPDWRTAFSVAVRRRGTPLFATMARDLISLEGERVRVRGWLRRSNGPLIELTHPEQIEVLDR